MMCRLTLIALTIACWICNSSPLWSEEPVPQPANWKITKVPGAWEAQDLPAAKNYDGYAWYRCYIKVPDNWVNFNDDITEFGGSKNLFSQSITITTQAVGQTHEIFVNGEKIGGIGEMPPKFQASLALNRTKIPPKLLKKGVYNTIAFRVYNASGPGGFITHAPNISGYFDECIFDQEMEFRLGDDLAWAIGPQEVKPQAAAYDQLKHATSQLDRPDKFITGERLTPEASAKTFTIDPDLAVDQVLTEPIVAQPTSMFFDDRGRLWVVQYRQYPYPAGMKIISRDQYYRAVYDKFSPPPPHHFKGEDRISIHEDTNGDGQFDKHKEFVSDLNMAICAVTGRGGVWVLNSPYLLFYPDKDQDDIPDGPPVVHLTGFGMDDAHSVANGLRWGPDGWLYFIQGSTISSRVKRPTDADDKMIYCEGKGTWRYHPETQRVELFNEGGYNALGIDFDGEGRLFGGLNAGNGRVIHEIQGAYYPKGGSTKFGPDSNPFLFGSLDTLPHNIKIMRFDHSVIRYEAEDMPQRFRNQIVSIDPLHQNMFLTAITPNGSSFKTSDIGEPLKSSDIGFRPVLIKQGPDGCIYVADFYEEFIAHGQHYQGQLDPSTGRIYRLRSNQAYAQQPFNYAQKSSLELIDLFDHPNKWQRQMALQIIGDRKDQSILPRLHQLLNEGNPKQALHAFWAINLLGDFNEKLAIQTISHANPMIRFWTVRLLGDQKKMSPPLASIVVAQTRVEENAEVRGQMASSAARFDAPLCLGMIEGLLAHETDVTDTVIPLLLWWALEKQAHSHGEDILRMLTAGKLWNNPIVEKHLLERLSRRYALSGSRADLLMCSRLLAMAPDDQSRKILMKGFELAYTGRSLGTIPNELAVELAKQTGVSLTLKLRLGNPEAISQALSNLQNKTTKPNDRLELILILGELKVPQALPIFQQLLHESDAADVQIQLLSSLQNYAEPEISHWVIDNYHSLKLETKEVAQTLLSSRSNWTLDFLAAIDQGVIDPRSISTDTVTKLTLHQDSKIKSMLQKYWPVNTAASNQELNEKIRQYQTQLNPEAGIGDPYAGKKIFLDNCAKCHRLFSDGQQVGPDLTQYKRDDSLRMLMHIVNPSAEIREGFENYMVMTDSGRLTTGFIVEQDNTLVTIRSADGQKATIPREEILEMKRQSISLMPEGLLDKMSPQQRRDLFAYLSKSQPIGK
jgi:putative heme-binding domain-containing protein